MRVVRIALAAALGLAAAEFGAAWAEGVLVSWSPSDLEGMTEQRWEAAKKRSVPDILDANLKARTWPEAYLCLVAAHQHKEEKALLSGLVAQLANGTERPLENTGRLILWERISAGEILFEGTGFQVEDDVFTIAGRANWILRSITRRNFGYVRPRPTSDQLSSLQAQWKGFMAGETVADFVSPYPAKDGGLDELRSPAAVEALIVSLRPNGRKDRKTSSCLRDVYHLESMPADPKAPARLCNPDVLAQQFLAKITDVPDEHDAAWWSKWWKEQKTALVWDEDAARFMSSKGAASGGGATPHADR